MLHEDSTFAEPRQAGRVMLAMDELYGFLYEPGRQKNKQKLLRNFMIVDLLVKILRKHDFQDEQSKMLVHFFIIRTYVCFRFGTWYLFGYLF